MISRALLNAPFFIPKDADLLRNRKVNTKKRQNRHLPELAFLILGTYFTAPSFYFLMLFLDISYFSSNPGHFWSFSESVSGVPSAIQYPSADGVP